MKKIENSSFDNGIKQSKNSILKKTFILVIKIEILKM